MEVEMNILKQIEGQHPARRMDFDTLYAGLRAEMAAGNVSEVTGPDGLTLYSYTIDCQFGKKWNVFSLIARGLVLDVANKAVVATPFPKFFNYGELPQNFQNGTLSTYTPDEPYAITEKMDGSLGIVFKYRGKLYAITRGSFQSDQAKWASAWLQQNGSEPYLTEGNTFLFEIIYPENRVVIPYDYAAMVLLAAYNRDGFEWEYGNLKNFGVVANLRVTNQLQRHSLEQLLEMAKTLPANQEGWVIRFQNGYRVKIKGDPYCRVHRIISNVTPLRVWEMMMNGDSMDEIRKQLPEELLRDFDNILAIYDRKLAEVVAQVLWAHEDTKHLSDKDCGILLSQNFPADSIPRNFVFPCRKLDFLAEVKIGGSKMRKKAFNYFKPKNNRLDGYTPSSAMNRFATADDS